MPLTEEEYEDAYREALLCLAEDGHDVGAPFIAANRRRICLVDGRTLDDHQVLELWWGSDISCQITEGRNGLKLGASSF
jgi:hypothetical protein